MSKPTCLITGTTHGIGRTTAAGIAARGFTLVMACRDLTAAEALRDDLVKQSGNPDIHCLPCDLGSLDSVRRCAESFGRKWQNLDLLINNAGTMISNYKKSPDGIEQTFAVNYLGPYLLTRLLIPQLRLAAAADDKTARIVNVASIVHKRGTLDLEAVQADITPAGFSGMGAYAASKLALVMFTLSLAERLGDTRITANCLHPGVVGTNIADATNPLMRLGMRLAAPFMLSPDRGAATSLHLALDPQLKGINGRYYDQHQRPGPPAAAAMDQGAREALWNWSERFCELQPESESEPEPHHET